MIFKMIIDKTADESVVATVKERTELVDEIENLVVSYSGGDKIKGYRDDDIKLLQFDEIDCIYVESGKTHAVTNDGNTYLIKMRLYEIEKLLPSTFIKINKSAIGNYKRIKKFIGSITGSVDVLFKCGHKDYVSRRCFSEIKRRFLK